MLVLAICLGTAALTQAAGLSLALGAFVAGLIISDSEYTHETLAELFPLRESFVALFFVTVGFLIQPGMLLSNIPLVATMIALIVSGKFALWTAVVWVFRYPVWMALSVAIGLTQIGEFSFILVQTARKAGIVGSEVYNATLAASLLSILLNVALVRYVPASLHRWRLAQQTAVHSEQDLSGDELRGHVLLCGFGRVGSAIGAALETFRVSCVVNISFAFMQLNRIIILVSLVLGPANHPNCSKNVVISFARLIGHLNLPGVALAAYGVIGHRKSHPQKTGRRRVLHKQRGKWDDSGRAGADDRLPGVLR
jgi:hypothetical protein